MKKVFLCAVMALVAATSAVAVEATDSESNMERALDWIQGLNTLITKISNATAELQVKYEEVTKSVKDRVAMVVKLVDTLESAIETHNSQSKATFSDITIKIASLRSSIYDLEDIVTSFSSRIKDLEDTKASTRSVAATYATKHSLSDYLKKDALNGYLKSSEAAATYLKITDASSTYLSKSEAEGTYLKTADAEEKFLTKEAADKSYGTKETADGHEKRIADVEERLKNAGAGGGGGCVNACGDNWGTLTTFFSGAFEYTREDGATNGCGVLATGGTLPEWFKGFTLAYCGDDLAEGEAVKILDASGVPQFSPAEAWAGSGLSVTAGGGDGSVKTLEVKVTAGAGTDGETDGGTASTATLAGILDGTTTGSDVQGVAGVDADGHLMKVSVGRLSLAADNETIEYGADGEDEAAKLRVKTGGIVDDKTIKATEDGKVAIKAGDAGKFMRTSSDGGSVEWALPVTKVKSGGGLQVETDDTTGEVTLTADGEAISVQSEATTDGTPALMAGRRVVFKAAEDSCVKVDVAQGASTNEIVVTIGCYYK